MNNFSTPSGFQNLFVDAWIFSYSVLILRYTASNYYFSFNIRDLFSYREFIRVKARKKKNDILRKSSH